MKITLVLHNIRSTYNVGAILRTAEGLGVERAVYSGYTPRYNDPELLPHLRTKLNHQIAKAALGAETLVPQVYLAKTLAEASSLSTLGSSEFSSLGSSNLPASKTEKTDLIKNSALEFSTGLTEIKPAALTEMSTPTPQNAVLDLTKWLKCATMEGYTLIGLENNLATAEQPRQLILGRQKLPNGEKVALGERIILILGEEVNGIPAEIRALVDYFLEIPMQGQKESFNVSVATGIALWGLQNCY